MVSSVRILFTSVEYYSNLTHFSFREVAKAKGLPDGSYTVMKLELANLQSVRDFVKNLKAFKSARPLNHLICNAAVYKPTDPEPAWTDDGFEMSMVSFSRIAMSCCQLFLF